MQAQVDPVPSGLSSHDSVKAIEYPAQWVGRAVRQFFSKSSLWTIFLRITWVLTHVQFPGALPSCTDSESRGGSGAWKVHFYKLSW